MQELRRTTAKTLDIAVARLTFVRNCSASPPWS